MTTTADAVEEAFLRGEWVSALTQSKDALTQQILKRGQSTEPAATMDTDDERLLSVYLQSVFELEQHDEVDTASVIVQSLEPLSFDIAIQWVKFLVAMDRRDAAAAKVAELQLQHEQLQTRDYVRLLDVLVFDILLPTESVATVRKRINADAVLDDVAKQQLLERIDAFVETNARAATASAAPVATAALSARSSIASAFTGSAVLSAHPTNNNSNNNSNNNNNNNCKSAIAQDDDANTYVWIGSAAIALAVAAVGAVRYKDRVRDAAASVVPAISKSLADAKYALFEA